MLSLQAFRVRLVTPALLDSEVLWDLLGRVDQWDIPASMDPLDRRISTTVDRWDLVAI